MAASRLRAWGLVLTFSVSTNSTGVRYLVKRPPLPLLWALMRRSKSLVIPV